MQFAGNSPYFYAVSFWACTLTTFLIYVWYEIRTLVNAHSLCMRHFWRSLLGYVMLSAKWYKSGILSSDTRSYIFAKRLSCNAFSLSGSISNAFKYNSHTSFLPEPSLRPPFGLMGIKIDYNYSKKTVGLQLLPGRLLPRFWGAGCKGPSPAHRAKEGPFGKNRGGIHPPRFYSGLISGAGRDQASYIFCRRSSFS